MTPIDLTKDSDDEEEDVKPPIKTEIISNAPRNPIYNRLGPRIDLSARIEQARRAQLQKERNTMNNSSAALLMLMSENDPFLSENRLDTSETTNSQNSRTSRSAPMASTARNTGQYSSPALVNNDFDEWFD